VGEYYEKLVSQWERKVHLGLVSYTFRKILNRAVFQHCPGAYSKNLLCNFSLCTFNLVKLPKFKVILFHDYKTVFCWLIYIDLQIDLHLNLLLLTNKYFLCRNRLLQEHANSTLSEKWVKGRNVYFACRYQKQPTSHKSNQCHRFLPCKQREDAEQARTGTNAKRKKIETFALVPFALVPLALIPFRACTCRSGYVSRLLR
jgi:hypothetical protein